MSVLRGCFSAFKLQGIWLCSMTHDGAFFAVFQSRVFHSESPQGQQQRPVLHFFAVLYRGRAVISKWLPERDDPETGLRPSVQNSPKQQLSHAGSRLAEVCIAIEQLSGKWRVKQSLFASTGFRLFEKIHNDLRPV